jgi:hypothetical protein
MPPDIGVDVGTVCRAAFVAPASELVSDVVGHRQVDHDQVGVVPGEYRVGRTAEGPGHTLH